MSTVAQFKSRLKYTCPRCGGRWRALQDAEACHGIKICTKQRDCKAKSHYGSCKSMGGELAQSYTLTEITELAREWSNQAWSNDPVTAVEEDLSIGLTLSSFIAWLGKEERERNERD